MSKRPTFKEGAPDHELKRQAKGLAIASAHSSSIKRVNRVLIIRRLVNYSDIVTMLWY